MRAAARGRARRRPTACAPNRAGTIVLAVKGINQGGDPYRIIYGTDVYGQ